MEQLVARWAHNPKVTGSSPVPATKKKPDTKVSGFFIIFVYMFTVYVLYSSKHQKIYIGFTSDLKNRLISHNVLAKKGWTVKFRPWELIYKEEFSLKCEAMKREKQLKSAKGREFIWAIIHEKH